MKETTKVFVTEHAYGRMKERLGLRKKSADRIAQRACERGIIEEDVTGRLSGYLRQNEMHNGERSRKILYGEHVFVFAAENGDLRLITVYQMDPCLKGRAMRAQRRIRMIL